MWNFDGTGMGVKTVKRSSYPLWHIDGPQFGMIIGFMPRTYDPDAIIIEGYAFFVFCGKFFSIPLEVSPVYPRDCEKKTLVLCPHWNGKSTGNTILPTLTLRLS